jgi:hypothetical protein
MGSLPTIAKDDNVPTGFADVSEQNHRSGPPSEMWLVGFAARRASYLGVSGKEGDNIEKKKQQKGRPVGVLSRVPRRQLIGQLRYLVAHTIFELDVCHEVPRRNEA